MNIPRFLLLLSMALGSVACQPQTENTMADLQPVLDSLKNRYAPDKRVALFSVEPIQEEGQWMVKGETNLSEAYRALVDEMEKLAPDIALDVNLLPSDGLEGRFYGVVSLSVANIRSNPKHSAELATQATLGTPLRVLKGESGWYLVQTPDGYIAWVDSGGIQLMTTDEYSLWRQKEKLIFTAPYGFAFSKPDLDSPTVSDLVGGGVLNVSEKIGAFYHVGFPDGREGFISAESAEPYQQWLEGLQASGNSLSQVAKKMMGVPYLWGGTSFKGVDCSGFTKTIYFMNGMVIPRDASQQVHAGEEVDTGNGFENLKKGDLLFFGRPATDSTSERVVHVAMWLGNQEFIHASGHVRINSFDPEAKNYNEYELNRFLRAKRILHDVQEPVLSLHKKNIFGIIEERAGG